MGKVYKQYILHTFSILSVCFYTEVNNKNISQVKRLFHIGLRYGYTKKSNFLRLLYFAESEGFEPPNL